VFVPLLSGVAAVVTAFSPIILWALTRWYGKKDDPHLAIIAFVILAGLCVGWLLWVAAIAVFWVICGFMISASALLVAGAYAIKALSEVDMNDLDVKTLKAQLHQATEDLNKCREAVNSLNVEKGTPKPTGLNL
jgi:hypothetical protein